MAHKKLSSWIDIAPDSDFSIYNLPYGIFTKGKGAKKIGVAIGEYVVDLSAVASAGLLTKSKINKSLFKNEYINDLMALGKTKTGQLREDLTKLLSSNRSKLKQYPKAIIPMSKVQMHLPIKITDYTDFYSSIEHATNIGTLFRDPKNALLPNWRHIPVGYHGRASSIVVSGTDFHRPCGQSIPNNAKSPVYGPSRLLDFELETGFIIGKPSALGNRISCKEAEDYIFGMVLFNDWSARDIQKWEYVPLGPFLGKNFASHISAWVVPMEALEPFRVRGPKQTPAVLPYLKSPGKNNYNIKLQVAIQNKKGAETVVCNSNFRYMYWNMHQQLAHHTVNGCNVNVGDLYGSGTISGKKKSSYGSMLELTWKGSNPIKMVDGTERKFIQDYDTVVMRGHAEKDGVRVGFGEVAAKVLPAKK
jgi:fumarylacetoacetase